jgi:hypothetical protein
MKSVELALDGAKPIISIERLLGMGEDRRQCTDEVPKCDAVVGTTFCVLSYTLQKLFIPQAVGLNVVKNLRHCGRWRKFRFSIVLSTSVTTTTTTTTSHPEEKDKDHEKQIPWKGFKGTIISTEWKEQDSDQLM